MYRSSIETEAVAFETRIEISVGTLGPNRRIQRITTMSTIRKIALISTLATLVAGPAFALDQDTAAVTINSGRYFGEQINYVPAGAHASVYGSARNQAVRNPQPAVQQ